MLDYRYEQFQIVHTYSPYFLSPRFHDPSHTHRHSKLSILTGYIVVPKLCGGSVQSSRAAQQLTAGALGSVSTSIHPSHDPTASRFAKTMSCCAITLLVGDYASFAGTADVVVVGIFRGNQ